MTDSPAPDELGSAAAGGRLRLIAVDQAMSGGSNVLTAVAAAHLLSTSNFGLYGLVAMVYMVAMGIVRSLVNDPVLVHPEEATSRRAEVVGANVSLGAAVGLLIALVGVALRVAIPEMGDALIILGICMPGLALQDLGRYLAFVYQRPVRAVFLDSLWLVLLIVALAVLLMADIRTLPAFIAVWAITGVLSALPVMRYYHAPFIRPGLDWLRFTWWFSWRYLLSYFTTQLVSLGAMIGVIGFAGRAALGGVQGSILLVRPYGLFQAAVLASSVSEIARSGATRARVRWFAFRTSRMAAGVALLNAVIMLVLPASLGRIALGNTWDAAKPLLLATGAQIVLVGMLTGLRAGLLGLRQANDTVRLDIAATVCTMIAVTIGAANDGAVGAVWGATAAQGLALMGWAWALIYRTREGAEPPVLADAPVVEILWQRRTSMPPS